MAFALGYQVAPSFGTSWNSSNEMEIRKKIGIKYCGGCNPNYERVELVRRVQSLMSDRFLFLHHDEQDLDVLVLMNGCPRACADKGLTQAELPCRSVIGEMQFESLIDWLTAFDGSGNI